MYRVFGFLFIILIASCSSNDVPRNILSPDKMSPILWQQIKADIFTRENIVNDSLKKNDLSFENEKLQMQIFKNFGVTKEEFYRSYNYYITHEDKFAVMIDTLIARQTSANLEYLKNQGRNYELTKKNIFLEFLLQKKPVFSMNPDTLPNENIMKYNNFNSTIQP